MEITCNNQNLVDEFLTKMRELRGDRSSCDICLNVYGLKIYAHRNVLACGSPYFFNMLYGSFTEKKQYEINLNEIDFEALDKIVEYFYSGDIKITEENVKKLFEVSDRILVDFIKRKCVGFLSQITNKSNFIDMWDFAESVSCDPIRLAVFDFMLNNFEDVIDTEEFMYLNCSQLYTITTDKRFKSKTEVLYKGVLKWVKYNVNIRKQYLFDLIKSIELKRMEKEFIKTYVATEDLIKEDHKCLLLLTETVLHHAYPEEQIFANSEWTDVVIQKLQPIIFILSSVNDRYKSLPQIYNPHIEYLKVVKPTNIERNFAGITCQKSLVYIAGGRTKNEKMSKLCNVYDIATNEWLQISSMTYELDLNALVSHSSLIYSMGNAVSGAQIYNPAEDVWRLLIGPDFGEKCSADVIGNRIYVASSRSIFGRNKIALNGIEAYDPRLQTWETLVLNPGFGYDVSVAAIENQLYISWNGENTSFLAEFDVRANKLIPLTNMDTPRPCHDLIKYEDHLYVIGGKNTSTVEEYDIKKNCWTYVNSIKGSFDYVQAVVPDYDFSKLETSF